MKSVALVVTEGVLHFELAAACEVFGVDRSELVDPWYEFSVCGPTGARVENRFRIEPDHGYDHLVHADTVILPGWADVESDPPAELLNAVRAAYDAGARIVSLCTGAFVLACAGLLDGRRATTHWLHAPALAARFPRVEIDANVLYIDEGRVLTSAGKAAAMDLCLHLVRLDHGTTVANAVARGLVVPPHRAGGQAQFIRTPMPAPRPAHPLVEVFPWVMRRLDQPITVEDMARHANMSTRTLARHFHATTGTTPLRWLLTQRIQRAQEMLETTDRSVDAIALATGMGTATTLRRHFNRTLGVPPDAYRRTFRSERGAAPGEKSDRRF
ncbi:helix-turn-helix domain-containing protein [Nocardia yamanashiensis]|uniref:GlxA family transcriptional regulator n=1 Tax=Nocardia yamanashiensis TaxID=209247 RepID=UPI001E4B23A7|nr:helix-turn-helix domain-containing protein [Nocardia yamanashiensis]UGT38547.1 helix-turn-helix domain-containing protein [Nocardia yamanashiensis]